MKKVKYITFPIVFSIISTIIITLFLCLNYSFYKNDYFVKIDRVYNQVDQIIRTEGYDNLTQYITKDTRITLIDTSTHNVVYDTIDKYNPEGDFYSFNVESKANSILFSTSFDYYVASKVYNHTFSSSLLRIQIKVTKSFRIMYCIAFIVPISYVILSILFCLISYQTYKHSLNPIKYQIKKFYNITSTDLDEKFINDPTKLSTTVRKIRKNIEVVLEENEKFKSQINFILDSIEQGLIVFNGNEQIIMINNKACEIFKLNKVDSMDKTFTILDNIEIFKLIKIVTKTLTSQSSYITIEDRVYDVEISLLNVNWSTNSTKFGYSIFLIDVTDEYNARKMKEEFFANVAHEIKSPLTTIIGYQEMIRDKIISTKKEIKEANEITIKEANRLKSILNNMLGVSSIERNELRPIVKLNIKEEIDKIIESEQYKLKLKNISVYTSIDPYIIKMNTQDFDILFRNLIENAIKYNKDNGSIYLKLDKNNNVFTIEDTGIGISKEHITRIFERFYRINKARSLKDGTGLGLALVKHTCKYYNFKIDVESKEDVGSKFIIYFK